MEKIIKLFRNSGAFYVGDSPLLADVEVANVENYSDNEIVRASWVDDDGLKYSVVFTEGGLAAGYWDNDAFVTEDNEGDLVKVQFLSLQVVTARSVEQRPRVLVTVSGGVANYVHDDGVDIELFDFDNYRADPANTEKVPARFADLGKIMDAPVESGGPEVVQEGSYSGKIVDVADGVATQKIGRDGATARHAVGLLSGPVTKGDVVDIRYRGGRGEVAGKSVGVER